METRLFEILKDYFASDEDIWLNTEDTCEYLGVSRSTLLKLRKDNKLPYSRIGRKVMFRKKDLNDYLNKNYSNEQ